MSLRRLIPLNVLASQRWHIRMVVWTAGIACGAAVVAFAWLSEQALRSFFYLVQGRLWLTFLLSPAIGMLVVWATLRWAPQAQGSGIPQVIAGLRRMRTHQPVSDLLSLRLAAAKIGLGALALLGGYSAGREGPSVQVGAAIAHAGHRWLPLRRAIRPADLALAGGAAGIAAAFNTPLAGIVFAVEELGRRLETRTSGVLISLVILSGLVSLAWSGDYRYFGQLTVGALTAQIAWAVLLCGLLCGLLGGLFSRLLLWPQRLAEARATLAAGAVAPQPDSDEPPAKAAWSLDEVFAWRSRHPVWFAGLCGLLIAALGYATGGVTLGSGYALTLQALGDQVELPWYTPLARLAATAVSYFSGIPGGIFAPSLAAGASLGFNLVPWLHPWATEHAVVALCMAGLLAAVTQSPLTAAVIVMEMIDGHSMVISLFAVALLAKAVGSRLGPELYQTSARRFEAPTQA
jgi:H+/Cl- antiporter ClcA